MKVAAKVILKGSLLVGCAVIGLSFWKFYQNQNSGISSREQADSQPDPKRYKILVEELERWHRDLSEQYRTATSIQKAAVEKDARLILELIFPEMMRCWLGTPYDFNGTAESPGDGKIACGYFVSTLIRDAGFQVNRYQLAQQPAENILRTFLPANQLSLQVDAPYPAYADSIESMDEGIYLIGLDTHVGFIVKRPDGFRFIHASGSKPWAVVEESRETASAIRTSKWRMIGCLTSNTSVLRKWLNREQVTVQK